MQSITLSRDALVDELFTAAAYHGPLPTEAGKRRTCAHDAAREERLRHVLTVAKELLLHDLQAELREGPVMDRPETLRDWLILRFAGLDHEVFLVVFLDAQNRLIDAETMFRGTLTQTSVYPREIVKTALARNAASVAFAHNHPSGKIEPSRADEALTATLKSALALVDIRVLDHFIIAGTRQLSFAESGRL